MAFVTKTERNFKLNQSNSSEIGPGQYLSSDSFIIKEESKAPFNSGSDRFTNEIKSNLPGPGAYELPEIARKYNQLINDKSESMMKELPLYKTFELSPKPKKKAVFGSKESRFKTDMTTDNLGPGVYYRDNSFSPKKQIFKKSPKKIKYQLSTNKTNTIPYKSNEFGYVLTDHGGVLIQEDPDIGLKYKGTKNDSVGPGSYEIDKTASWIKRSIDWSRGLKNNKSCLENNSPSNYANSADLSDYLIYENTNNNNKVLKNSKEKVYKLISEQRNNSKRHSIDLNKGLDMFDSNVSDQMPGPGYYYKNVNKFYTKNPSHQNFGSSSQRFEDVVKSYDSYKMEVGPSSYFQQNRRYDDDRKSPKRVPYPEDKIMREKVIQLRKEKMNEEISKIGPGTYNPLIEIGRKVAAGSCIDNFFGSRERRFYQKEKVKDTSPGPGTYIQVTKWEGELEEKLKMNIERQREKIQLLNSMNNNVNAKKLGKIKQDIPPVGSYHPEYFDSLSYKIAKKSYQYHNPTAPFSTEEERFNYGYHKTTKSHIGPGYYYKEPKNPSSNASPPFNSAEPKMKPLKNIDHPSPGEYQVNSYWDWNKKSFNKNFI
jgi:hypothetical protein